MILKNTTAAERNRVFQQISHAVHFNKNDLANITFSNQQGIIKPMLHQREIIHLQDVATLISILMVITTLMTMIWDTCYGNSNKNHNRYRL